MKLLTKTLAVLGVCLLAGCAKTPYLDKHMGDAVRTASMLQVANPNAPAPNAAIRMDGQNAAAAVDQYNKAGKDPAQSVNVFTIGVGNN